VSNASDLPHTGKCWKLKAALCRKGSSVPPELSKAHVSDLEHLQLAIAAAGVTLWAGNVDSDELTMDDRAFDLWGVPRSDRVTFEDLSAHIHPADRERVRAAFSATRAIVGPYEIDFRIIVEMKSAGFPRGAKATTPASAIG
jgi:PAS domain-containing protein